MRKQSRTDLRQERRETHGKKGTGQHRHVHRKTGCPEHGTLCRVYGADAGLRYMVYYNGCEGDTIRLLNENTVESIVALEKTKMREDAQEIEMPVRHGNKRI